MGSFPLSLPIALWKGQEVQSLDTVSLIAMGLSGEGVTHHCL